MFYLFINVLVNIKKGDGYFIVYQMISEILIIVLKKRGIHKVPLILKLCGNILKKKKACTELLF